MTNQTPSKIAPPSGMTQSDTDLDNFEKHSFKAKPLLEGKVLKIKHDIEVQTKQGPRDTSLMVVQTADGPCLLWMNANLEDFFKEVAIGAEIWVHMTGEVELDSSRTMKKFDAYYTNP